MNRPASIGLAFVWIAWTAACAEPNQAPFSCGPTAPQSVDVGDSVSFMPCFTDPDADPLTISAEVAHHLVPYAATSASGGTVTVHGKREHLLMPVTITATDPAGLEAVEEVDVAVRGLHDLAILDAWPDSQSVRNGRFQLNYVGANIGGTLAKVARWCPWISSDSVITTADTEYTVACFVFHDMPPEEALPPLYFAFTNHPDPEKPYWGVCGVSETPEHNLANNCSKGLKVIFPDETARESRHAPPSGSIEVKVPPGMSVGARNDSVQGGSV